ncbi:hypothetical protein VPH35_015551 [Triticum aestivum]
MPLCSVSGSPPTVPVGVVSLLPASPRRPQKPHAGMRLRQPRSIAEPRRSRLPHHRFRSSPHASHNLAPGRVPSPAREGIGFLLLPPRAQQFFQGCPSRRRISVVPIF